MTRRTIADVEADLDEAQLARDTAEKRLKRRDGTIARLERQYASLDRILGERLADVKARDAQLEEADGHMGKLANELGAARSHIDDLFEESARLRRQLEHLRTTYEALSQRYAGVKLDTQQFNFGQARQWLENEDRAMIDALVRIQGEVGRGFAEARRAAADPSTTALGARGAISRRDWVDVARKGCAELADAAEHALYPGPEFAEVAG